MEYFIQKGNIYVLTSRARITKAIKDSFIDPGLAIDELAKLGSLATKDDLFVIDLGKGDDNYVPRRMGI